MPNLTVVVPAAGLCRRIPLPGSKTLLPVNGEPILLRNLRILSEVYPFAELLVVCGNDADRMRRILPSSVRMVFSCWYKTTNVAYSVKLGIERADSPDILVVYGDLVYNKACLAFDGSLQVLASHEPERISEVGITELDGYVSRFAHGVPTKWGQMVYLPEVEKKNYLELMQRRGADRKYVYEILNGMLERGSRFTTISPEGMQLCEVDSLADYEEARSRDWS